MKRFISFIVVVCILTLPLSVYANQGRIQNVFDSEEVATTNTVTSRAFPISSGGYFGTWIDLDTGIGSPNVDVSVQMSYDDVDAHFATPTSMSLVLDDATSTDPLVKSIQPSPMKYMRFKVDGNTANTTGTTITMYLFSQD